MPQEPVFALSLVVSSYALCRRLEAKEDTPICSAGGCLHILPCFPGWAGERRPGFG